jgi:hypothetical protein
VIDDACDPDTVFVLGSLASRQGYFNDQVTYMWAPGSNCEMFTGDLNGEQASAGPVRRKSERN